jgi:hypothetical protein
MSFELKLDSSGAPLEAYFSKCLPNKDLCFDCVVNDGCKIKDPSLTFCSGKIAYVEVTDEEN